MWAAIIAHAVSVASGSGSRVSTFSNGDATSRKTGYRSATQSSDKLSGTASLETEILEIHWPGGRLLLRWHRIAICRHDIVAGMA